MLHIEIFTLGNEFKDSDGNVWKVNSSLNEENKIFVELVKVVNEELKELIKE